MKKSIILIITGIFIIVTGLLCNLGKTSSYKKKISFSTPEEVIEKLNLSTLATKDPTKNNAKIIYSDDFYECLSKRKRLTDPGVAWSTIDMKINKEKNITSDKERILNDYIKKYKNLKDFKVAEKIEAYSLVGQCTYVSNYEESINVDVVFIDEGNGWVIDYFMYNSNNLVGEVYDTSQQ